MVAAEPELILLDEPTAGMTAEETRRIAVLIGELSASTRWSWSSTTCSSSA